MVRVKCWREAIQVSASNACSTCEHSHLTLIFGTGVISDCVRRLVDGDMVEGMPLEEQFGGRDVDLLNHAVEGNAVFCTPQGRQVDISLLP